MNLQRLRKDIIRWESIRYEKYICGADKPSIRFDGQPRYTIGVGHLIQPHETHLLNRERPLTNAEVMGIFEKDLKVAIKEAEKIIDPETIEGEAFEIFCHLSFWLGSPTLRKFVKTIQYLKDQDYVNAGSELLDSKLGRSEYRGVVNRITELSARMTDV